MTIRVFLSHSSRDKSIARDIALDLELSSIDVWLDEWEIRVGDSITQKISRGLEDSRFVVVLLSKDSVDSGWVQKEWASKIGVEAESRKTIILPACIDECSIPILLRDKKRANMQVNYAQGIRDLVHAISTAGEPGAVGVGTRIISGQITVEDTEPRLPSLRGMINTISKGCFLRRDEDLQAVLHLVGTNRTIQNTLDRLGLSRITLECRDYVVSRDENAPSVFRCTQRFSLPRGELLFDFSSGNNTLLPFNLTGEINVTATVYSTTLSILGRFEQDIRYFPPSPIARLRAWGNFMATVRSQEELLS